MQSFNCDPEKSPNHAMLYFIVIVDIVDQQSKSSMRYIVPSVSPKYYILLTMVHLPFKTAIFVTYFMGRTNTYNRTATNGKALSIDDIVPFSKGTVSSSPGLSLKHWLRKPTLSQRYNIVIKLWSRR